MLSINNSNELYRICLVGTHGTGKTTLGTLVEGELKRNKVEANFIKEISGKAKSHGMKINEDTNLETQTWILHKQFEQELFEIARPFRHYKVFIYDRGPDNWCYLARAMENNASSVDYALQMTLGHIKLFPYSKIYLIPIVEEEIDVGGGVRSTEKEFQLEMDVRVRKFLSQYEINHIELPVPHEEDPTRKEWVEIVVKQTLTDLGKPLIYPIM